MRKTLGLLLLAACSHEIEGPTPSVGAIEPGLVCNAVTTTLSLTGAGLSPLAVDALTDDPKLALPTVTLQRVSDLEGNAVSDPPITLCEATDTSCTLVRWISQMAMEFDVTPELMLEPGVYQITVANANGHSFTATVTIEVVGLPELTSVTPSRVCPGGADIVIEGENFAPGATVTIGDTPAMVNMVTPSMITATVEPGMDPGTYDVIVDNGGGCIDTLEDGLEITPGPAVFFVDPPVVYDQIAVQATIYVSGLDADPATVGIRPSGSDDPLAEIDHTWDPAKPNRILAIIPAELAVGDWAVVVSDGACEATLENGFTVTDTLVIDVLGIEPTFGWTGESTAVTVTGGADQFQPTPRVYLNPDVTGPATVASQLNAVAFVDATRLTAIVPAGLPEGLYDLFVINPDGTVGLLDQAFTVTALEAPPPIIETITPASVVNQADQAVTIIGANFRTPAVTATCEDQAGAVTVIEGAVADSTATTIDVSFDMDNLLDGAICVIRVTNDDATFFDFSALAVTNPAQNIPETVMDDAMTTDRRALAGAAGRVTAQARYVYAIGGDDGTDGGLLSSIETAPVDLFGKLAPWALLPLELPEGRSHAGVGVVDRFIYLVGGRTAAGATDSVLRAQILDPEAAPVISDLEFDYQDAGLGPGLLYYRVSAVFAEDDETNPGGEGLASDPIAVIVPPAGAKLVVLTVHWQPVPGAVAYRVYRTAEADQLLEDIGLLAEVTGEIELTDDGSVEVGAGVPLPTGALGTWREVGPLTAAREGPGVAVARDPDGAEADGAWFVYAIGGRDAGGTALDSYDYARVAGGGAAQSVEAFSAGGALMAGGRWQMHAVAMDNDRASVIAPGETWVYALGGVDGAGTGMVREVTAALVGADGLLSESYEVDSMSSTAGYGYAAANNFIFLFGGGTTPSAASRSGKLCGQGDPGCGDADVPEPPELVNWNALGFTLLQPRYLPGSALESAFIFLCGGQSDLAAATATCERTHW